MAQNITPVFAYTGMASGDPVAITAVVTNVVLGTGAVTVATFGTNGSFVSGIQFMPATPIGAPGLILIYYNNTSSLKLVGYVSTPANWGVTIEQVPRPLVWFNPAKDYPLNSGDSFSAGLLGCSGTVHAWCIGSDL